MKAEAAYWLTVALVAIASVILFKLAAASEIGDKVPGVRKLAAFI